MHQEVRRSYANLILLLVLGALLLPDTFTYIIGAPFALFLLLARPSIILWYLLAGYGLYSAWSLTIRMKEFIDHEIPLHIYTGIISGILAFLIAGLSLGGRFGLGAAPLTAAITSIAIIKIRAK